MTEESELIKKFTHMMEDTKKRKIEDFDGGLLNESYEHITGTSEEKYERWCERLINVATRLENILIYKKHKYPEKVETILRDIDVFFKKELPQIRPTVDDYTQEKGRFIKIHREDGKSSSSCIPETFSKTVELIREEQYSRFLSQIKILERRARALLPEEIINWHQEDFIEEIDVGEDNGR